MSNTLQIKRGLKASLPTLAAGEPAFCTDTYEVFVGDGAANHQVLMYDLFNAGTFLYATGDNTPEAKSAAQVMAILSGSAGDDFAMNSHKITGLLDPTNLQDAATKNYVDAAIDSFESSYGGGGATTFLELTDTPEAFTDKALYLTRVNAAANALEFVEFAATYLEGTPTEDLATKAPTSEWAYDHKEAATGVHGAGVNTILHSGSTIDGGGFA